MNVFKKLNRFKLIEFGYSSKRKAVQGEDLISREESVAGKSVLRRKRKNKKSDELFPRRKSLRYR